MNSIQWKFGVGQTAKEERQEMNAAKLAGLVDEYPNGQRCSRLIEAEKQRRLCHDHKPVRRFLP